MNIPSEMKNIYKISLPQQRRLPLVFDSPHSGEIYPQDFDYACDPAMLRRTEDQYVEDLYGNAPDYGAAMLMALFPRHYIDVNRAVNDIDEEILSAPWPAPLSPSIKSIAGHGLIHRLVRPGLAIYDRKLSFEEIEKRIQSYYRPYHGALKHLLDRAYEDFGQVWHINCHSMSWPKAIPGSANDSGKPADFVLGDRDGISCDPTFTNSIKSFLVNLGYKVQLNNPYKGADLITSYSNPFRGRHSLQIEINKALYMDELRTEKSILYNGFKSDLDALIQHIADWVASRSGLIGEYKKIPYPIVA